MRIRLTFPFYLERGLSDLFIDPKSLPDDGYGFIQLLTLTFGYGA